MGGTATAAPAPPADLPVPNPTPGRYIVTMASQPIAAYDGSVPGYVATQPEDGERVNLRSSAAQRYRAYLNRQQNQVARRAGVRPQQRFAVGLSAFTATMTGPQARILQRTPGVRAVTKDTKRQPTDDKNPIDYLGLSGPRGVWSELGGTSRAGRGVVIGVLDTGIWPESPSFAGAPLRTTPSGRFAPYRAGNRIIMQKSDRGTFVGACETGEDFTPSDCNTKVIGARAFSAGWEASVPANERADYDSPRDGDGHGSHTASTAGGNANVQASIDGVNFGRISGVAPAAKLAAYKVCWRNTDAGTGCFTSDLVDAVDTAITDGVDVINFSIGGGSESELTDPVELAFLSAASAGIFVSASAGNSGPGVSTLDHPSPWITTVAASTVAPYYGSVELGNGAKYVGVSTTVNANVGSAPLVNSSAVGAAGKSASDVGLCVPNALDPAKAAGKIIVCDRGVIDRVAKSAEVKRVGGVGMILVNLTPSSLDADLHFVPTVHVNPPASQSIKAYAGTAGATARLVEGNTTSTTIPYPQVAGFSSRGPSLSNQGDLIKPDLAAPGVAVLAAVAPPSNYNRSFEFYSGTSMAAPHVAGLAALWFGVKPRWSPMKVKSALMTTAGNTKTESGRRNTDPFAQGAGEVRPRRMVSPGLVFPARDRDWLAYLEGQGIDTGTGVRAKDPSDYNSPSIGIGSLLKTQTVTRRVQAVEPGIYRATASIPGVRVRVSPSILRFSAAGETKTFRVTFDNRSAPFDEAATGFLTWRGAGNRVRIPLAVTPKVVDAPKVVSGSGTSGAITYRITPGVSGRFPIVGSGLSAGEAQTGTLAVGESRQYPTTIAANTKVAQFTVRTPNSAADLDLYVFRVVNGEATLVDASATGAANETVVLPAPTGGQYVALVDGFGNAPGTTTTPYTFRAASVRAGAGEGNFTVTPANPRARVGVPITVRATWSGLSASTPYLGYVEYPDGSGTIVQVN